MKLFGRRADRRALRRRRRTASSTISLGGSRLSRSFVGSMLTLGAIFAADSAGLPMPLVLAVGFGVTTAIHLMSLLQNLRGVAAEDELHRSRHLAGHDELTGLPNRKTLMAELARALDEAKKRDIVVGVLFLDLDRFKAINDSMGHAVGDDLLRIVAERLGGTVRATDVVGRFGGDEFVMICSGLLQHDTVARIARAVQAAFVEPIRIRGSELLVKPSIGVATAGKGDPRSAEDLLRDADTAMYAAKRDRSGYCVFGDHHRQAVVQRMEVERELIPAFSSDQFKVFYQPIVKWSESRLSSFEALVRWEHPEMGLVGPDRFLPVVEDSGLMTQLGESVLKETLSQHAEWAQSHPGARHISVGVNVAESQLVDRNFPEVVREAIAWAGLGPAQLTLEITEDVLIEHLDDSLSVLRNLHDLGVSLVIDDFGTGRSSLSWVKKLDMIDAFKIDRSFITGLPEGRVDVAIIDAIVGMATALDLKLVAEGVETVGQAYVLRELGVDLMQGYLFQKPAPAGEIDLASLLDPMVPLHPDLRSFASQPPEAQLAPTPAPPAPASAPPAATPAPAAPTPAPTAPSPAPSPAPTLPRDLAPPLPRPLAPPS